MLYSYVVASFILAGVSATPLQHNLTDPQPTQANTLNSTHYYIGPDGTLSSSIGKSSPTPHLSKREDPPDDDPTYGEDVGEIIDKGGNAVEKILDKILGKNKITSLITVTVTTSSEEPETTTITQDPVTTTVTTSSEEPETKTVRTTVFGDPVTTTISPSPVPSNPSPPGETVTVPAKLPGCYHVKPDASLGIGDC